MPKVEARRFAIFVVSHWSVVAGFPVSKV